jgi:hypothetical protein
MDALDFDDNLTRLKLEDGIANVEKLKPADTISDVLSDPREKHLHIAIENPSPDKSVFEFCCFRLLFEPHRLPFTRSNGGRFRNHCSRTHLLARATRLLLPYTAPSTTFPTGATLKLQDLACRQTWVFCLLSPSVAGTFAAVSVNSPRLWRIYRRLGEHRPNVRGL